MGITPDTESLRRACRSGDAARVTELITAGADPDAPLDTIGTTPLMIAATPEVVDALLIAGASPHPTRFGEDALQVVLSADSALDGRDARLDAARRLLDRGAEFGRRTTHGWSRLYVAAFAGDADAVELLLALDADPNDDPAPLAAACWGSGVDPESTRRIIDALVTAGADVHRRDEAGWHLLHAAAMPDSHGVGHASSDGPSLAAIDALLDHGAEPDVTGPDGLTALMLVAGDGSAAAVDALLAGGADPAVRDDDGRRAVDHARDHERRLTEVLATATTEHADAVRHARDRARECVDRLGGR